jgi:prepilin-type N-terminal cleavage/methylation domain-containing protein
MMRRTTAARGGFTLVEMLVAVAVVIVLSSLALLVVPSALDQDRTTDGASLTRQWLMIAKARAARDQLPRGVRLIVDPNKPTNLVLLVTEMQYVEVPPLAVPNPAAGSNTATDAFVQVTYNLTATGDLGTPPRQIFVRNLTASQAAEYASMSYLYLPAMGINLPVSVSSAALQTAPYTTTLYVLTLTPARTLELDDLMGAENQYLTFHFGLLGGVRPLVGEQIQQLPKGICIDLASSSPAGVTTTDYDIVFAPNGQVLPVGLVGSNGQINLWVRDLNKSGGAAGSFATGGEQQVVSLKAKSGALGVFPIAQGGNPFQFAQQWASAPAV